MSRHRNELARRDHATLRVAPAHQGFGAGQRAIGVDHRLEMQLQLVALQTQTQVGFQRGARQHRGLHLGVEETQRVAPFDLGAVHGQVGPLEQLVHRVVGVAEQCDTNAG